MSDVNTIASNLAVSFKVIGGAVSKATSKLAEFMGIGSGEKQPILETTEKLLVIMNRIAGANDKIKKGIEEREAAEDKGLTTLDRVRETYQAIGGTLKSSVMNIIDQAFEGTMNWRETVRGLLKDLAKAAVKQTVSLAFSAIGLAEGGVLPKGMGPLMPLKGYAEGGPVVNSPHLAMVGEGGGPEAVVPLTRGRKIPVEGGGGKTINLSMNISAMDSKSFLDRVPEMKNDIIGMLLESGEENPALISQMVSL